MPLLKGKSKKAFSENVETEMHEGKPQKQALAIAYSMKRKNKASGGTVSSGDPTMNYADGGEVNPQEGYCPHCGNYSQGGMVANADGPHPDESPNNFDDLSLRDHLEFSETGANSGDEDGTPSVVKRAMKRKKND